MDWQPISEADKGIATIIDVGEIRIGNSYPIWARDTDGRIFECLWADTGKRAYWWDIEGESPVDPVEFMPHPLDPKFEIETSKTWAPSRTAPKGEMVLVCDINWPPSLQRDQSPPMKVGYLDASMGTWKIFGASWCPTHWMPLPSPPEEFESGANAAADNSAPGTASNTTTRIIAANGGENV